MSKNKTKTPAAPGAQDEQNGNAPIIDEQNANASEEPTVSVDDIEAKVIKSLETAQGIKKQNLLVKLELLKNAKNENQQDAVQ